MLLTDLQPRWIDQRGERIGAMFFCPACRKTPLTVFWKVTETIAGDGEDSQYGLFAKLLPTFGKAYKKVQANDVVPCRRGYAWQKTGDSFENISLQPSLDASAAGHWHGFVTNGGIVNAPGGACASRA